MERLQRKPVGEGAEVAQARGAAASTGKGGLASDQRDAAQGVIQKQASDSGGRDAGRAGSWVPDSGLMSARRRVAEERVEFDRFDDEFLDPEVAKALAAVPGNFRPADLKAMLAQETGDFTDTAIAGLEGKTKGIVNKLDPNPSFVGIGQINAGADTDARKMAKELGIVLPAASTGAKDPRKDPASGIKLAANYLAYIGKQLSGLPAGAPTGAEMRKLVLAAYNGGPFGLLKAANAVSSSGSYTWATISASQKAMQNFLKPGEVKDYVRRVTERAP